MADTVRTWSAFLALLADNTSGAISPQDLRDSFVSVSVYGAIYVHDGATAQSSISTTPAVVTAFNTAQGANGAAANVTADKANNKLTIGSGGDGTYVVFYQVSATSVTASTQFTFEVYDAGAATGYASEITTNATPDDIHLSGVAFISGMVASDDIELYVYADGASKAMTITQAQLACFRIA